MTKITGGTLTPAYGRDYTRRADVVDDLNAGLDFYANTPVGHGYCSIRDLADGQFQVRDQSLRKVWTVNVRGGMAK